MSGSKTNSMTPEQIKEAVCNLPSEADFVWDGQDEDDRPATLEELQAALEEHRSRKGGRPRKGKPKRLISIRFSQEVLEYFRATGPGWQTRMDEALKEWIRSQQ